MHIRELNPKTRNLRSTRPTANAPRPKRSAPAARRLRNPTICARQIMALVRDAKAEERAAQNPMQAYGVRQRLEQRLTILADRIADKPLASRDDLLTLALAGWYASGARQALVRTVLRAGAIEPGAAQLSRRLRQAKR